MGGRRMESRRRRRCPVLLRRGFGPSVLIMVVVKVTFLLHDLVGGGFFVTPTTPTTTMMMVVVQAAAAAAWATTPTSSPSPFFAAARQRRRRHGGRTTGSLRDGFFNPSTLSSSLRHFVPVTSRTTTWLPLRASTAPRGGDDGAAVDDNEIRQVLVEGANPSSSTQQQRTSGDDKWEAPGVNVQASTAASSSSTDIRVSVSHQSTDLASRIPVCEYHEITVPPILEKFDQGGGASEPRQLISTRDLTPILKNLVQQSGMRDGTLTVLSRHTTTSIVINEHECRLADDIATHLLTLTPIDERSSHSLRQPGVRYKHNDLDQRPDSPEEFQRCLDNGFDVRDPQILELWRSQEPINAHSHLLSMLLGSSESIPVVNGSLAIGQWQSVLMVDLDGPRTRTVAVNLVGYR